MLHMQRCWSRQSAGSFPSAASVQQRQDFCTAQDGLCSAAAGQHVKQTGMHALQHQAQAPMQHCQVCHRHHKRRHATLCHSLQLPWTYTACLWAPCAHGLSDRPSCLLLHLLLPCVATPRLTAIQVTSASAPAWCSSLPITWGRSRAPSSSTTYTGATRGERCHTSSGRHCKEQGPATHVLAGRMAC